MEDVALEMVELAMATNMGHAVLDMATGMVIPLSAL